MFNKGSYLKACFAWAQGAGYFPMGDNPAAGQVKFSTTEKRHRRKLGFQAFTPNQVKRIYAPEALEKVNEQTRWGALVGLYTGARVTEVGQLRLDDFFTDDDGVWCLRVTDEGSHRRDDTPEVRLPCGMSSQHQAQVGALSAFGTPKWGRPSHEGSPGYSSNTSPSISAKAITLPTCVGWRTARFSGYLFQRFWGSMFIRGASARGR
ncbi:hypothetical protein [Chiayiivirga flava]|uniref:Integrase n=1 Tax=Chiayiivirga flava TaxID=659595 RepID=A0A7W8D944_9GAMM|nr:hypothetical protein [Chiayiivirga flava]MBB5209055.1 integrase [Chiayiivirga flava]